MQYIIRMAVEADFENIMGLIHELADFQGIANHVLNSPRQMKKEQEFFKCLVAEKDNKEIIGIAVYFVAYYTWVGKSLYLDDLVVKKAYRNNGIGTALLEEIKKTAQRENCRRLRWQVSSWNKNAINLYKKMGANIDKTTHNCDINQVNPVKI